MRMKILNCMSNFSLIPIFGNSLIPTFHIACLRPQGHFGTLYTSSV